MKAAAVARLGEESTTRREITQRWGAGHLGVPVNGHGLIVIAEGYLRVGIDVEASEAEPDIGTDLAGVEMVVRAERIARCQCGVGQENRCGAELSRAGPHVGRV